jgi:uncharacterized protein
MPSFANPFTANVERKMTKGELIQAIRLDIAGELEAIYLYDAHVQATDDQFAKTVLADIRDEEKTHMGELFTLLKKLDPGEAERMLRGEKEVQYLLLEMKKGETKPKTNKKKGGNEGKKAAKLAKPLAMSKE